jgi:hypothetical protein
MGSDHSVRLIGGRSSALVAGLLAAASASCALIADLNQFDGYATVAPEGSVEPGLDSSTGIDSPAGVDSPTGVDSSAGVDSSTGVDSSAGVDSSTGVDSSAGVDSSGGEDRSVADDTGVDQDAPSGDGTAQDAADAADGPDGDGPSIPPNPLLGNSWCSVNFNNATVLCDDFDQGRPDNSLTFPYGGQWDQNKLGGSDAIDTTDHAPGSPPSSLDVHAACVGPQAPCEPSYAQEQFISPELSAPAGLILSFAVKSTNFDVTAGDVSIAVVGGASDWRLSLDYAGGNNPNSDNQFLEGHTLDGGASVNAKTVIAFPDFADPCEITGDAGDGGGKAPDAGDGGICIGGWVTIQMVVDVVGTTAVCATTGGPCVTLTYDGQNAIVGGETVIPITPPPSATMKVVLGDNFIQGPAQAMLLQFDNIKVDALR